jgi:hypothetical protein
MAQNLPTYFIDSTLRAARAAEYAVAGVFDGGMNLGGSCAPGIGINTGDYDPKASDWPRIDMSSAGLDAVKDSQQIGEALGAIFCLDPATVGDDEVVAFGLTTGAVAPDAIAFTSAGFSMRNRTGKTVPDASWLWAVGDQV